MRINDLIITIAYFSIPIQIVASLCHYPRLAVMPARILALFVLFALFILLCGAGHLLRCLHLGDSTGFAVLNTATAIVSVTTAVYLLPLIPSIMNELDSSLQRLVRLNEETADSKRKLYAFMSFLCHEVRNPLFAITSMVAFMEDMNLTDEQASAVNSINQASCLMLRLVNDVLDLSRVDSGRLTLEERNCYTRTLFGNVANCMKAQVLQSRHGNVQFQYTISEDVPDVIHCDYIRILQIVYNLLCNACKFTSSGQIVFSADICDWNEAVKETLVKPRAAEYGNHDKPSKGASIGASAATSDTTEDGGYSTIALLQAEDGRCSAVQPVADESIERVVLKMTFEDTGTGMEPERVERIFQPFAKSKLSDYRQHGGTGLGLPLIYKLIGLMGGTLNVESEMGKGSKFTVHLPVQVPQQTPSELDLFVNQPPMSSSGQEKTCPSEIPMKPVFGASRLDEEVFGIGVLNPIVPDGENGQRSGFAPSEEPQLLSTVSSEIAVCDGSAKIDSKPGVISSDHDQQTPSHMPAAISIGNGQQTPQTTYQDAFPLPASRDQRAKKPALSKFDFAPNVNVVLVVDDNLVNRKLLGKMLSSFNLTFLEAVHGLEAVETMAKSRNVTGDSDAPLFGLVLMDICMPVMDGYDAIRALRRDHNLQLPIVALTANALVEGKEQSLAAGATEFATKPILRHDLHAMCQRYLPA